MIKKYYVNRPRNADNSRTLFKEQRRTFWGAHIEVMIEKDSIIKKPYGNIYYYDSKEYILTGNFNKSLVGSAPFLVENKSGRVVGFGTSNNLEYFIKAYENGTLTPALTRYWYPDEDRFDYK